MTNKTKIIEHPHSLLRAISDPVVDFDDGLNKLLDQLTTTLGGSHQPGIGLAAVQIGVPKRVVLADVADDEPSGGVIEMINPQIIHASSERDAHMEGCLSMPEVWLTLSRPQKVTVGYFDRLGNERELTVTDYCSAVVQHEMDHMDGTLIIDHVSPLKRKMALGKLKKYQKLQRVGR